MTTSPISSRIYTVAECVGMTVNQYMFDQRRTKAELGSLLGVAGPNASKRISGKIDWSVEDLMLVANWLGLEITDLTPSPDGQGGWIPAPFIPGKAKAPTFAGAFQLVRHGGLEPSTRWLRAHASLLLFALLFFWRLKQERREGQIAWFEQEWQLRRLGQQRQVVRLAHVGQEKQFMRVKRVWLLNCEGVFGPSLFVMKHVLTLDVPTSSWRNSIMEWEQYLLAGGRSAGTVYVRLSHVRKLARGIEVPDPQKVSRKKLLLWCASQNWAADTRHSYYVSFRQFFTFLCGASGDNPSQVLPAVHRRPGVSRPTPETVIHDALERADERLQMILLLGVEVGLRGFEIAKVHERDVQADLLGFALSVRGKGEKVRSVPLSSGFAQRLIHWCHAHGGYAFPGQQDGHLSRKWISTLVSRVLPRPWTLHTLRHRFANAAYQSERDITAVQDLLGHSKLDTTRNYIATDRRAMRNAAMGAQLSISPPETSWTIPTEPPVFLSFTPSCLRVGDVLVPLNQHQMNYLALASAECLKLHQETSI